MPAKENVLLLSETETKLIRKDVDNLVQNIKDNLKLNYEAVSVFEKGGGGKSLPTLGDYPSDLQTSSRKSKSFLSSRGSRASPYSVPGKGGKCDCDVGSATAGRSWAARKRYPSMSANGGPKKLDLDDPLEMLHELIRYFFAF